MKIYVGLFQLAALVVASVASSEMIVELDGDNALGNGPDTVSTVSGDHIDIDVWLTGGCEGNEGNYVNLFVLEIVNPPNLDFVGGSVLVPPSWSSSPVVQTGDRVIIETVGGSSSDWLPGPPPYHVAELQYSATVENSIGSLEVDLSRSAYICLFPMYFFGGYVGTTVEVGGSTGVEGSSWSGVKQLFR